MNEAQTGAAMEDPVPATLERRASASKHAHIYHRMPSCTSKARDSAQTSCSPTPNPWHERVGGGFAPASGALSSVPTHTQAVSLGVKPANQASRQPSLVPVLPAARPEAHLHAQPVSVLRCFRYAL